MQKQQGDEKKVIEQSRKHVEGFLVQVNDDPHDTIMQLHNDKKGTAKLKGRLKNRTGKEEEGKAQSTKASGTRWTILLCFLCVCEKAIIACAETTTKGWRCPKLVWNLV